jgi:hypothetical protein
MVQTSLLVISVPPKVRKLPKKIWSTVDGSGNVFFVTPFTFVSTGISSFIATSNGDDGL